MYQLLALIKKEFLAIWSDKKSRAIIIIPPLIQLLLFSFAVTFEVKNISLGILDRDNSVESQELVRKLSYSKTFTHIYRLKSEKELTHYIDTQKVLATLYIPQNFSKKLESGETTSLQIIADGRKSNTAQIAQAYIQRTFLSLYPANDIMVNRNWYNPNLDNFWWIVPNLMGHDGDAMPAKQVSQRTGFEQIEFNLVVFVRSPCRRVAVTQKATCDLLTP